jgi:hypothetical protein
MNLLTIHIVMIKIAVLCYILVLAKKFVKNNILKIGKSKEEKQQEFNIIMNEAEWILTDRSIEIIKYLDNSIIVTYTLFFILCFIPIINIVFAILMLNVLLDKDD